MRKFKLFLLALTGAAILMLGGCKEKQTYDEAAFENDMESARQAGSNGFITKPINIKELKATLSSFLPELTW